MSPRQAWIDSAVLTPQAMARADAAAIASGIPGYDLMERAGRAVSGAALAAFPDACRFVVLCGPGNNGGDGYVAARELSLCGSVVKVFHLGDLRKLRGDAKTAFDRCPVPAHPLDQYEPHKCDVVIDALFGAGLARDLEPGVLDVIGKVTLASIPVVAVDLPSGIDGESGRLRPAAFQAERTVTFMCRKPGHLLLPGRSFCGRLDIVDIGIPQRMVAAETEMLWRNHPHLWFDCMPAASPGDHKYRRGHVTVFSGPYSATGAGRLAAEAALRVGAGIVAIAAARSAMAALVTQLTAVMLHAVDDLEVLSDYLKDPRHRTFVLGPGFGNLERARHYALTLGRQGRQLVLDADGITAFREDAAELKEAFAGDLPRLIVTPHDGEFSRLFPELSAMTEGSKVTKTRLAAQALGAVVLYKGADTVIAAPDGRAVINDNAPPSLATAGSGDVLAGIIAGMLAQGVPAFEAACAAAFLHGEAGRVTGSGMTSEDLVAAIRPVATMIPFSKG